MFADRRLIHAIEPEELAPARLAKGIFELLVDEEVPNQFAIPALDGAKQAARALLAE